MESKDRSNDLNKPKIESNEDTYLKIKDNKNQNSYFPSNNYKENENEEINYNNNNYNQNNSNNQIGVLNRITTNFFFARLGNTFAFFGDSNGSPLLVIGPHWPMYLCCCSFISLIFFLFFKHYWDNINYFFKLIGLITFLMFFLSYSYTSLINPGIPKYDENAILGKPRENYRYCKLCCIWTNIEENTCHCFDCNVCYEGYDHHCPWTGKCIAKNNTYSFYIFLVSILCIFGYFVTAFTHVQHNIFVNSQKNKKLI